MLPAMKAKTLCGFLVFLACSIQSVAPAWGEHPSPLEKMANLQHASLLVEDESGNVLHSIRAREPMIPASTLKLLTALIALKTWGADHQFHTDFFLDDRDRLWIKGYGDPMLISEEIDMIVEALKKRGLKRISALHVDSSFIPDTVVIDGQSRTDNPYDAPPGALVANYNTIYVQRNKTGVTSAEPQTPLTPLGKKLAATLKPGKYRINLGPETDGALYFAEVFREKLKAQDIIAGRVILNGVPPDSVPLFYRHFNSHNLAAVISGMLKYSNNFIANQLFLMIGAEYSGSPADMGKSRQAFADYIRSNFQWNNYQIVEGAGLSRKNRLSSQQLVEILKKLSPHIDLIPALNRHIRAKSGTLKNVSSYAGFLESGNSHHPFALMINQKVAPGFSIKLAESLVSP
jgi:D-alanyl-D-alanine carboxypeptidase/D-alanyl-D-alanine-endopeptidase (penicillin-binding protein 4)